MVNKYISFKKNIIIILIAALFALGVGGTAVALGISNMPANRVSRYMGAAERYLSEMNYEQAVIEFQRILEIEPMNVDAYLGLADAYIGMGETDKAIDILREGYEKTGDSSIKEELDVMERDAALSLGKQYLSENHFDDAIEQFEKALAIDEKNVDAYIGLADAYLGLGDTEKAIEILRKGLDQTGDLRLQAKIDELVEPNNSDEEVPEIKPEYGSMGSVMIAGTELDIATTEALLIFNKTLYDSGNWRSESIDNPENHYDSVIYLDNDLSKEEYNKIASLSQLKHLEINYAGLTDLSPLASLTNLKTLFLNSNQISDITPLAELTNLQYLYLDDNQINDITPLAKLINLRNLALWENQISDITPLAELTNLQYLYLDDNQINNITPLARLINLTSLGLAGNQISDITLLSGFTSLHTLYLEGNQISNITPLVELVNLQHLNLGDNQISDITPLTGLINLTHLDLWGNQISNITPLARHTNLQRLALHYNQISDITPLAGLINLTYLDLWTNQINDITPLAGLTSLQKLYFDGDQITETDKQWIRAQLPNCDIYD